jgi:hypothetical protein
VDGEHHRCEETEETIFLLLSNAWIREKRRHGGGIPAELAAVASSWVATAGCSRLGQSSGGILHGGCLILGRVRGAAGDLHFPSRAHVPQLSHYTRAKGQPARVSLSPVLCELLSWSVGRLLLVLWLLSGAWFVLCDVCSATSAVSCCL